MQTISSVVPRGTLDIMDNPTRRKWDRVAKSFDYMTGVGPDKRWGPEKKRLFSGMQGKILFLALGTGLDIEFFPPGRDITAIDISPKMIEIAIPRVEAYQGSIEAMEMDVHELDFPDASFDQIFTSCTFCSVPQPTDGLRSLRRVLKPGGSLRMFEHTGSTFFPFNVLMNVMTPLTRAFGPDMNRRTVANVKDAGFVIEKVDNVYLDVVKTIYAVSPIV
jgi:ubiquinone/menaquinone biosynthesis C-methylase UbiE